MTKKVLAKDTTPEFKGFVEMYEMKKKPTKDVVKKDTMVSPEYKFASYYASNKVVPNNDALQLMRSLNPGLTDKQLIEEKSKIITPNYPKLKPRTQTKFNEEFSIAKKPDQAINDSFLQFTIECNQLYHIFSKIEAGPSSSKEYQLKLLRLKDSLSLLQNYVWPRINDSARMISRLQMGYYQSYVRALIILLKRSFTKTPPDESLIDQMQEIVTEIFDATGIYVLKKKRTGAYLRPSDNNLPVSLLFPLLHNSHLFGQVEGNVTGNEIQCNVYVFKYDSSGLAKPDPEIERYFLWYGPAGLVSMLDEGIDTSLFFKGGKNCIASTFPAQLGQGDFVFIYRDKDTGVKKFSDVIRRNDLKWDSEDDNILKFTIWD